MNTTAKRPIPVWIAIVILSLWTGLLILSFVVGPPDPSVLDEPEFVDVIVEAAELIAVVSSFALATWALATRRQWGRWLIAAPLAYMTGLLAYGFIFFPDPDAEMQNESIFFAVLAYSPLAFAIILVSFGENVKEYFSLSPPSNDQDLKEEGDIAD